MRLSTDFGTKTSSMRLDTLRISEINQNAFSGLSAIIDCWMQFSDDRNKREPPDELKYLVRLVMLDLSKNEIAQLSPKIFECLLNLVTLNLSQNKLKTIELDTLGRLRGSLECLDLSRN